MFASAVCSDRASKLESTWKRELRPHSIAEVVDFTNRLKKVIDDSGKQTRPLTTEEQGFIANELLLIATSFNYWCERYAFINKQGVGLERMSPLLESQAFVLGRIAELELAAFNDKRYWGTFVNVLKASRQVGVSTLAEAIGTYIMTTQNHRFGLIAADVPSGSAYLFDMLERIVENLPWWLRPATVEHVKNTEILFDGGSHVWVGAGKSTRGTTGNRGQLGRGRTISFAHLSELSSWEAPDQIESALTPTFPLAQQTFVLFESTAKGRGDWWHSWWKTSMVGVPAFSNIFIPWYVERKHSLTPPGDWSPADTTLIHAKRIEETSPRWVGRKVTPDRNQLYWYEQKRAGYEQKGDLKTFLEEFGSIDDDECFQYSGRSVFPLEALQKHQDLMRQPVDCLEIRPQKELR